MSLITSEFLKKKAREISYALNRVSFYIKRDELRNRLERLSFEFLENVAVAGEDISDKPSLIKVFKNISALDVLVRIGHSLYEIETVNSNILIRELDAFNSAIRSRLEVEDPRFLGNRDNPATGENSAMENNSEFGKLNLESMFSMPPAIVRQGSPQVIGESSNSSIENVSVGVKKEFGNEQVDSAVQSSVKDKQASEPKDFANIDNEKDIVERAYSKDSVPACQEIIRKFQNGITQQVRE